MVRVKVRDFSSGFTYVTGFEIGLLIRIIVESKMKRKKKKITQTDWQKETERRKQTPRMAHLINDYPLRVVYEKKETYGPLEQPFSVNSVKFVMVLFILS